MKKILFGIFFALSLLSGETLKVGERFPAVTFMNQFDQKITIQKETKQFIVVFSKDDGEKIKRALEQNPHYLEQNKALYGADLSEAPSLVISMFMKPKFKKYKYSMILIEDSEQAKLFPRLKDKITVISLDSMMIKKIEFKETL